jgi:hypothetical protein
MKLRRPVMGDEEAQAAITVLRAVHGKRILVEHDQDKVLHAIEAMEVAPTEDGDKSELNPRVQQLGKFARKSDTSRKAAIANYPRSGTQRGQVLQLVAACGTHGATREEIGDALDLPVGSVNPRVRELLDGDWLQESDTRRKTRYKNDAVVLVATDKSRKRAEQVRRQLQGATA